MKMLALQLTKLSVRRAGTSVVAAAIISASFLVQSSAYAQAGKRTPAVDSKNGYHPHDDPQLGNVNVYTETYTSKEKKEALRGATDVHGTTRTVPGSSDVEVSFRVQKGSDGFDAFVQLKPGVQGPVTLKALIKDKEICSEVIKASGDDFVRIKVKPKVSAEVKFVLSSPAGNAPAASPAPAAKKPLGSSLSAPVASTGANNLVDISIYKERPAGSVSGGGAVGIGG